jgi:hypothetical protein
MSQSSLADCRTEDVTASVSRSVLRNVRGGDDG